MQQVHITFVEKLHSACTKLELSLVFVKHFMSSFQCSSLQHNLQEEREKQMTMVRERIQKVKFERTQTMLRRDGREKKAFLNVLGDESESKSLSQDEKMSLAAEKMQQKFLKEQAQYKAGEISVSYHFTFVMLLFW